jgi:hypothetical protein
MTYYTTANLTDSTILHTFGEIAIVLDGARAKIRAKLQDKGLASMFVGYPDIHAGEVCHFLNLKTKKLSSSRTAIFLKRTYADCYNLAKELISNVPHPENEGDGLTINKIIEFPDEESKDPLINLVEDQSEDEEEPPNDVSVQYNITSKGLRELRNLQTLYNPDPPQYVDTLQHAAVLATFKNPPEAAVQATMMETQTQRHIMMRKQVMIGQTGGEQCALNLKTCATNLF